MPKINAPFLNKVRQKTNKVRSRIKFRKKVPLETLNESHAREMVVRTVVVPFLKQKLGNRLKAVLIVGSAQLGVRKATGTTRNSDTDIVIVVGKRNLRADFEIKDDLYELGLKAGARMQLIFKEAGAMKYEIYIEEPFQVVFGKNFVEQELGKDYEKEQKTKKERARKNPKYASRI